MITVFENLQSDDGWCWNSVPQHREKNIIFKQPKVLSDIYVLDNVLGYAVLFYIGDEAYAV